MQAVLPVGLAAHRRAMAADADDRRASGDDGRPVGPVPVPLDDGPVLVPQVPHGRDAVVEVRRHGRGDGLVQPAGIEGGQPIQRVDPAVAAQVGVRVDKPGQQRRAGPVDQLVPIRHGRCPGARFDGDDHCAVDEHHGAARNASLSVEGHIRPVRPSPTHACSRHYERSPINYYHSATVRCVDLPVAITINAHMSPLRLNDGGAGQISGG